MPGFNFRRDKGKGGKPKRLPVFTIVLIAAFIIIPAALFIAGLQDAPGRATPTPKPTPTPDDTVIAVPSPTTTYEPWETPAPLRRAVKVRGIYYMVEHNDTQLLERFVDTVEATNLNAIVIDVKDDFGRFTFQTDNEVLSAAAGRYAAFIEENAATKDFVTAADIANMKSRGIYTIARIVCFKDDLYAVENPSVALQSGVNNRTWRDSGGKMWLNPYNKDSWDYILEACIEAAKIGFDEIQLDYVRFPTDGRVSEIDYGTIADEQSRYQIISEFTAYIREQMRWYGLRTSADIFAITGISYIDARNVGQNMQYLLGSLDIICPMIYPSHFANSNTNGIGQEIGGIIFDKPDTKPYEVVYNTLQHYVQHIEDFKQNNPGKSAAIIRPYLQYFTADWLPDEFWIPYGPEEIHMQIKAVTDAGFDEWILWPANNTINPDVIP